jgi:hypothetical protein
VRSRLSQPDISEEVYKETLDAAVLVTKGPKDAVEKTHNKTMLRTANLIKSVGATLPEGGGAAKPA